MLYERFMQIAGSRASELALVDHALGKRWTFKQLVEAQVPKPSGPVHFVRSVGANFIFDLLGAWKQGVPACPLEPSQPLPEIHEFPLNCAHIKITSGTTGVPSQIAFSAEQLFADAENIVGTMGFRPEWPNLSVISMAHSYGFSNLVTPLLLFGIPLVIGKGALPQAVAEYISGDCTVSAVPALWRAWQDAGIGLSQIKLAISAGAPLPVGLEEDVFNRHGVKIHNFYGSSECGGIAFDRTLNPRKNSSLAGSALDNVQLSINPEGCLQVTSNAVGISYLPSSARLQNGTFTTNDLVEIREGEVYLLGRAADTINVAGRKVSPEKIEQALLRVPGVKEAVVFGVEDPMRGEDIVACIQGEVTANILKQWLGETLQPWEFPREIFQISQVPKSERGKTSRAQMRNYYKNGFAELPGTRLIAR